ncbi:GlxA family transcriptional regulator [Nocardia sp. NBC_01327]|uniref:GlxA family transcriptional regulator n=1 Tax=Nocardia sp. NBC_01327 TaxID=2903593 RepID=UPI002E11CD8A|nr:helix-turn-helix domain-containing protein [Nocardia sp. NBC_01327]
MHTVAVLALPDTIAFDLTTPIEVFGRVTLATGRPGYRVLVCGTEPVVTAGPLALATDHGLDALLRADTIVVPGRNNPAVATPPAAVAALRAAAAAGTRIASICVGAFTVAEAGLLDGKRATTHWFAAELFRSAFPRVDLDPDVLYVDNGQILTSAGASAGLDLCLHLVRRDYGTAVAAEASRLAVAPLHRDGGQAQFIVRNRQAVHTTLAPLLHWIEENAHRDLTLEDLAAHAATSIRTLNRRFHDETGQTPMQWLNVTRIRLAQELLETTDYDVERIARRTGFTSATNFRTQFKRLSGVAPTAYRRTYHGG